MATPTAIKRLTQDYRRLKKDPVPYIEAVPLESNILEWRYCVKGPEDTPYYGGFYHGKLMFPGDYPFKPPRIMMITPNGRFQTNKRLCLSISDFHPDTWNPAWSVSTILTGLLSFMVETAPTVGSINTSEYDKKQFAIRSWDFNLNDKTFCRLFPNLVEDIKLEIKKKEIRDKEAKEKRETLTSPHNLNSPSLHPHHLPAAQIQRASVLSNILWNLAPFVLFASFMYIVQLVLKSS